MSEFTGLPADFFPFFEALAENNNRPWFEENKDRFRKTVQDPLLAFVEAIGPKLKKVSPHYVADARRNGGSVFRIYRDVRFSKDKSPYKTHAAVHLRHARGKDAHTPGFYLHLAPDEIFMGGGIWMPPAPALLQIREAIRDEPELWNRTVNGKAFKNRFGSLRGDALTRPPRGFDKDDPHIDHIKHKSFFAMRALDRADVQTKSLLTVAEQTMKGASPLIKFLCDALDVPF
ncbi:MAG: DUF2461 domain-containing protein [Pseudomonadota bacterium]